MPEKSLCSKSRFVISVCESLNVKSGPNVIAGLKCKVRNNTRNADKCYVN